MKTLRIALFAALTLSFCVVAWWISAGRPLFTQQTRVFTFERAADPDDFMDIAQADPDGLIRETVHVQGFWLGLAPSEHPRPGAWAPNPLWLSVVSIVAPLWLMVLLIAAMARMKKARRKAGRE